MMGQITKEFAENLLERTEAGKHVNTTVWEEQQLVNAWLALHGYKTWPGMPQVCTRNSCSGPNDQLRSALEALYKDYCAALSPARRMGVVVAQVEAALKRCTATGDKG